MSRRATRLARMAAAAVVAVGLVLGLSCAPRAGTPPGSGAGGPKPVQSPAASPSAKPSPKPTAVRLAGPLIGVLSSEASFRISGWMGRWETEAGIASLRHLDLRIRVITDADLAAGRLDGVRVLLIPNARCISRDGAARVTQWVQDGGRLLATGMSSYRDEANRRVGTANEFQWADLFGASFRRWLSGWPRCEYLQLDAALAREVAGELGRKDPLPRVQLGRNTAMLVEARPDARVLATWLDADGRTPTSDAGGGSAAIVGSASGRVIYAGENLAAPELIRSPEVQALLLALLRRLDGSEGFPARLPRNGPMPFTFPRIPTLAIPASADSIRVGIRRDAESIGLGGTAGLRLRGVLMPLAAAPGARLAADGSLLTPSGLVLEVRSVTPVLGSPYLAVYSPRAMLARAPAGLDISGAMPGTPVQVLDLRPNGTCRVQAFRGSLELKQDGPRFAVVNVLGLDEYVAGVVPNEVPGSYPPEALKAMAVIARTFALSRKGFHGAEGHDVCNTVHCQMYGGMLTEWESSTRAVIETAGDVVEYHGTPADATFHAVCGGVGEDVELVWPQPASPYLVGTPDSPSLLGDLSDESRFRDFIDHPPDAFCSSSPRFRWTETYTLPQMQSLFEVSLPVTLGAAYHGLGTLQDVRVSRRSSRGRVLAMEIVGSEGTCTVEKDKIRWLWSGGKIGQGGLQSTLFYIEPDGASRVFHGGGWGHGVGMCQDGAAGRALRGLRYPEIIDHYYPGTRLVRAPSSHANRRQ